MESFALLTRPRCFAPVLGGLFRARRWPPSSSAGPPDHRPSRRAGDAGRNRLTTIRIDETPEAVTEIQAVAIPTHCGRPTRCRASIDLRGLDLVIAASAAAV